jgi:hypothetical protein
MTLGNAAAGHVRLIIWCLDAATKANLISPNSRGGASTTVPEWRERATCSRCGRRKVDMAVTGTQRR